MTTALIGGTGAAVSQGIAPRVVGVETVMVPTVVLT
jgi:hypothetical protein